jgi:hypothetical protein
MAFRPDQMSLARSIDGTAEFVVIRRQAFPVGWVLLVNSKTLAVSAPRSKLQWERFFACGQNILQSTSRNGFALWRFDSKGEGVEDAIFTIPILRSGFWHFAGPPGGAEPFYVVGNEWYLIDPIAKTACRIASEGTIKNLVVLNAGWTNLGPVVWGHYGDRIPCMYRIVVSKEKLKALSPADIFTPASGMGSR